MYTEVNTAGSTSIEFPDRMDDKSRHLKLWVSNYFPTPYISAKLPLGVYKASMCNQIQQITMQV